MDFAKGLKENAAKAAELLKAYGKYGDTSLHKAVRCDESTKVNTIIADAKGVGVIEQLMMKQDLYGYSALICAARKDVAILELLLEVTSSACLQLENIHGQTALSYAVYTLSTQKSRRRISASTCA